MLKIPKKAFIKIVEIPIFGKVSQKVFHIFCVENSSKMLKTAWLSSFFRQEIVENYICFSTF